MDRGSTVQFCEPWSVHTVQTVALFQALKWRNSISSFFFFLYGVVWSIRIEQNLTLKRWNPRLTLSITLWAFCLSLTLSITSLVFASLPHRRRSSAQITAQSISQVTLSITLYLSLTLISASLSRRCRNSLSASLLSLLLHPILA